MNNWLIYALLSMLFAGFTAVIAKHGLQHISADLGNVIRTTMVLLVVVLNFLFWHPLKEATGLTQRGLLLLALSGLATAISWIFYYKAIKLGPVSQVTLIDKGSVLITLLFSAWLLQEQLTPRVLVGGGLVLAGLLVLAWKV